MADAPSFPNKPYREWRWKTLSKFNNDGPKQFKPISAWGYIGYSILFSIPIIGLILLIVFALSDRNINRRNYARSFFCWVLVAIIIGILMAAGILGGFFNNVSVPGLDRIQSLVQNLPVKTQAVTTKPTPTIAPVEDDAEPEQELPEKQLEKVPEASEASADTADMVEVQVGSKTVLIDKSFKDAMDNYEAFFDEYVDALESQDPIKLPSLTLKYAQTMEAFEKIADKDLTDAEEAYYIVVHSRISKKLMQYQ